MRANEIDARLYALNCASAEWHEATGEALPEAQRKFLDALRWFQDRHIAVRTVVDSTYSGVYVLQRQEEA